MTLKKAFQDVKADIMLIKKTFARLTSGRRGNKGPPVNVPNVLSLFQLPYSAVCYLLRKDMAGGKNVSNPDFEIRLARFKMAGKKKTS